MLTIGILQDSRGQQYLSCAATHLTAFASVTGRMSLRVSVNMVHPIDDAGNIGVRVSLHCITTGVSAAVLCSLLIQPCFCLSDLFSCPYLAMLKV